MTLPIEYLECEYIESFGNEYIELNIQYPTTINSSGGFGFDIKCLSKGAGGILGCYFVSYGAYRYILCDSATGSIATGFQTYINASQKWALNERDNDFHTFTLRNGELKCDNVSKANIDISLRDYNIRLFTTTGSNFIWKGAIQYAKLYDGNNLIADLVPCVRISDKVAGLYDVVNNVFHTNKGTGAFGYKVANLVKVGGGVKRIVNTYIKTNNSLKRVDNIKVK